MVDYTLPLDELPDPLPIVPLTKPFDVTITPPGSKSITNRAYILAALAKGESRIIRPLRADDTDLLLKALCTLGAEAKWVPGETGDGSEDVLITGVNGRFPRGGHVNLGDGGTPTRFMIAAACLAAEPVVVDGSARMRERPVAEGVDMLRKLGAQIEYVEEEGRLPVRVMPSVEFKGGEIEIGKTQSSQFVSALMLIGAWLKKGLVLRFDSEATSQSYVDLTSSILYRWGVESIVCIPMTLEPKVMDAQDFFVQPDASSAVYWWTAAAEWPHAQIRTPGIGGFPNQPDTDYAKRVLRNMGARTWAEGLTEVYEMEDAAVGVQGGSVFLPHRRQIDMSLMPDGSMSLAVLIATASHEVTITGLHTLRVKECDRLAALETELRKVGCEVETTEDSITIWPIAGRGGAGVLARLDDAPQGSPSAGEDARAPQTKPIIIETYNDHRMAMAFAVLGLRVPGIAIRNPAVVSKSYPTFWKDFAKLYE